jgi:molybdate transport system substrate-binding protein
MIPCRPLAAIAAAALLAACQPSPASVELTVFAAASLTDALEAVQAAYAQEEPGVRLVLNLDSSAALRTQIQEGAPADVFLSADTDNPTALVAAGLTDGGAVPFAGNTLALIQPAEADPPVTPIDSPAALARGSWQIIAAGPEVPITAYVDELLANLSTLPGYPPDFAEIYAANVVSQEDNVRAVLAKIELGEGDAAFVYRTDARSSDAVTQVPIPVEANVRATYAGCVIADSDQTDAAHRFLEWLAGPDGFAILAGFGFVAP